MAFKQRSSGLPFKEMGSSPAKQSYPSSAQTVPHGPTGTLDEVKKIRKAKNTKILDAVTNEKSNVKKQLDKIAKQLGSKVDYMSCSDLHGTWNKIVIEYNHELKEKKSA